MGLFNRSQVTTNAYAVTPHDTNLNRGFGFYVGTSGDVTVVTEGGQTVAFVAVPAGAIVPVSFIKVMDTGTDAEDIVRFVET